MLWSITGIAVFCLLLSIFAGSKPSYSEVVYYQPMRIREEEGFENAEMQKYADQLGMPQTSGFQNIPLTAPDTEDNSPSNLTFGQASRYVMLKDSKPTFLIEISANLWVLDGGVLNQPPENIQHNYVVYAVEPATKNKISLGSLKKDGDGIYKMRIVAPNVQEIVTHKVFQVVYEQDGQSLLMLQGRFK
jgi:hypothetical protein